MSSVFNVMERSCVLFLMFRCVLRGEVEVALCGLILSKLLSAWSEVAEVLALGREGPEDVAFSAREADLHDSQFLVRPRMLQMVFEHSKCVHIGLCRLIGGVIFFRGGGGRFLMYFNLWPRGTCAACLSSCTQLFVLF